jgi:histidyl-tRNA synthetase
MSQRYQAPRGTQDILPPASETWQQAEAVFRRVCHRYGYQEIRPPVFEDAALFSRGIGEGTDIVSKEMYVFEDRGGRSLSLRPEGTAGIARAFIQHGLGAGGAEVKLYYTLSIFRYERPQAGRYRQSHQVGVECFGSPGPDTDAEVIALNMDWYRELGIEGHTLALNSVGCPECRPAHRAALREALRAVEGDLCDTCRARLETNPMRVFDCKSAECQALLVDAPATLEYLCAGCEEHLNGLTDLLGVLKVPYAIDRRLVRGLDYYTRTAFEVKFSGLGAQDALSGGGRYDGLVEELGGKSTPGIGFACGVERAVLTLEKLGISLGSPLPRGVFVAGLDPESRRIAFSLASELRALGARAEIDHLARGLGAQLKQADRVGARYALIVGEDERQAGEALLRDLTSGDQQRVPLTDAARLVAEQLSTPS